jgi:predicted  nucleic acid-binding Zn-ribbon protein
VRIQTATKPNRETAQSPKIEELVGKLKEIQSGLKHNLADLQQKLAAIDSEPELFSSLLNARRDAESRANNLEAEIKRLREELKAIKDLLGSSIEKK